MCGYIISYQGFWLDQDSKPISRNPKSKWSALDLQSGLPRTWLGRSFGFLVGGPGSTKCWKTSNQLLKDRNSMFSKGSQYWCELDYTIISGSPTKKLKNYGGPVLMRKKLPMISGQSLHWSVRRCRFRCCLWRRGRCQVHITFRWLKLARVAVLAFFQVWFAGIT